MSALIMNDSLEPASLQELTSRIESDLLGQPTTTTSASASTAFIPQHTHTETNAHTASDAHTTGTSSDNSATTAASASTTFYRNGDTSALGSMQPLRSHGTESLDEFLSYTHKANGSSSHTSHTSHMSHTLLNQATRNVPHIRVGTIPHTYGSVGTPVGTPLPPGLSPPGLSPAGVQSTNSPSGVPHRAHTVDGKRASYFDFEGINLPSPTTASNTAFVDMPPPLTTPTATTTTTPTVPSSHYTPGIPYALHPTSANATSVSTASTATTTQPAKIASVPGSMARIIASSNSSTNGDYSSIAHTAGGSSSYSSSSAVVGGGAATKYHVSKSGFRVRL